MSKDHRNRICRLWIVTLTVLGACGWLVTAPLPCRAETAAGAGASVAQEVNKMTWEEALQAFQTGDYRKALSLFEILVETAGDEDLRRRALFAAASSRFLLAQTRDEYLEALAQWESWSRLPPSSPSQEDPRLLTPFLIRMTPPAGSEKGGSQPQKVPRTIPYSNLLNCKESLLSREKELDYTRSRLAGREREIKRLRNQITTLEEIHLKFQEKKQEATSQ